MTVDWGVVATVLVGLIALGGTVLTVRSSRHKHRLDDTQVRYDQMQEDLKAARDRVTALESRVDLLVRREQIRDDYIGTLRMHIATGQPPPPPAWPAALVTP